MRRRLFESEMDQAALILAAKSVLSDLQSIAERVAKMEASGIMPLLDGIKLQFGPQFATDLSKEASEAIRSCLDAITTTKDKIGSHITKMEKVVNGESDGSDMSDDAVDFGSDESDMTDDTDSTDDNTDSTDDNTDDSDTDDALAKLKAEFGSKSNEPKKDMSDHLEGFDEAGDQKAKRETKESILRNNINILKEQRNPDRFLINETIKNYKRGMSNSEAVVYTAKQYSIDPHDLASILRKR